MYFAVNQVLEDNATAFSTIEVLVAAHGEFKSKFAIIDNYRQIQESNESGLTAIKASLRKQLMELLMRTLSALKAQAVTTNNQELMVKCSYTVSVLNAKSDPVFSDIVLLVHGLALPLIDQLGQFFLSQEHLDEMQTLNSEFKAAIPKRRVAVSVKKVSTLNIGQTMKELDQLLKEKIDLLIAPFEYTEADFYRAYRNARTIVDYRGGGHRGGPADDQAA